MFIASGACAIITWNSQERIKTSGASNLTEAEYSRSDQIQCPSLTMTLTHFLQEPGCRARHGRNVYHPRPDVCCGLHRVHSTEKENTQG